MPKYDVYLGGTCINSPFLWDWRTDFIRMLDDSVSYYDPFIRKWEDHPSDVNKTENNDNKRKESKYCVFVFTSDIIGLYSVAQAVEDSIKRDNGTVLVAFIDYRKKFDEDKHFIRSMHSALELCESNGAIICESIQDMVKIINGACKK